MDSRHHNRPTTWAAPLSRRSLVASAVLHATLLGAVAVRSLPTPSPVFAGGGRGRPPVVVAFAQGGPSEPTSESLEPVGEIDRPIVDADALDVIEPFEMPDHELDDASEEREPPSAVPLDFEWRASRWSLPAPDEAPAEVAEPEVLPDVPAQAERSKDAEPILLEGATPRYPALARRMRWEGSALLRISVDDRGRVAAVAVEESSGYPVLDEAAVEALGTWRFRPGLRGGRAAATELLHRVSFRLDG